MSEEPYEDVLIAIRRIIRAIDLQSRKLVQSHGLTGPQALLLKELSRHNDTPLTAGELAKNVSLSQATITDIVKRLEQRGLVIRARAEDDKRRTNIQLTPEGVAVMASSPSLLQDTFSERFSELEKWEQTQLLFVLQRIASMMDADTVDASPVLASGSIVATEVEVENVLDPK